MSDLKNAPLPHLPLFMDLVLSSASAVGADERPKEAAGAGRSEMLFFDFMKEDGAADVRSFSEPRQSTVGERPSRSADARITPYLFSEEDAPAPEKRVHGRGNRRTKLGSASWPDGLEFGLAQAEPSRKKSAERARASGAELLSAEIEFLEDLLTSPGFERFLPFYELLLEDRRRQRKQQRLRASKRTGAKSRRGCDGRRRAS